jgi:hypothetical protein
MIALDANVLIDCCDKRDRLQRLEIVNPFA